MASGQDQGGAEEKLGHRSAAGESPSDETVKPPDSVLAPLFELFNKGRYAELEGAALQAGALYPRSATLLQLLGASRLARGLDAEAVEALRSALEVAPGDPGINNLLGLALSRCGRHEESRWCFEASLAREGENYETLVNATAAAIAAGDFDEGRRLALRALQQRPQGVEAMVNLGNALAALGQSDEAIGVYRRAIALAPKAADLYLNLGHALTGSGRHEAAAAALRQALTLRPGYAPAHLNLGRALHELGDTRGAQHHFRVAADLDPSRAEAHSAYLFALSHDPGISAQDAFREHVRIGDRLEAPYRAAWREHGNDRDPERALRIGFVSGDLHDHPIANLIEPVWRGMRTRRNRIYAYANGTWRDAVEARLKTLAHEWLHVERMTDDELAERIREDRIDILFDLSGHTALNRLLVFARKPAPVQVTWLGYPGTTGLSAMDYRLLRGSQRRRDELQPLIRERLVLFGSRTVFAPPAGSPPVNSLPALQQGRLTFGSFNRPSKLGAAVVALWSRVLLALPDSHLLIAGADEQGVKERLTAEFAVHGIAAGRLQFRPRAPMREYLEMHHHVDIALDTFPYTGGTTTMFALWMGVPVLTLAGASVQQNQAASSLVALDLADWVTRSEDEFVERACRAAADLAGLDQLRSGLRANAERKYLGTNDDLALAFDATLRAMWRRWCGGQQPEGFTVPA